MSHICDMKRKVVDVVLMKVDNRGQAPVNSYSTPSVAYDTLYQTGQDQLKALGLFLPHPKHVAGLSRSCRMLFLFMLQSGCRISEALLIRYVDILALGDVVIKGAKGSHDRIIQASLCSDYLIWCRANCVDPFFDTNYIHMYRELKRIGVGQQFGTNENLSVTHWFRHAKVLIEQSQGVDIEASKRALGHKSVKSTEAYAKRVRRKSGTKGNTRDN